MIGVTARLAVPGVLVAVLDSRGDPAVIVRTTADVGINPVVVVMVMYKSGGVAPSKLVGLHRRQQVRVEPPLLVWRKGIG